MGQRNLGVGYLVNTNLGQTLPCLAVSYLAEHILGTPPVQIPSFTPTPYQQIHIRSSSETLKSGQS